MGEDQRHLSTLHQQLLQAAVADIVVGADDDFVVYHHDHLKKLSQPVGNDLAKWPFQKEPQYKGNG